MDENRKFYLAIGVSLVIIFMLSYYVIQEGQKDTYTVLYFSNPVEPLSYSTPDNTIKVNFIIENHEDMNLKYIYAVLVDESEVARKDITVKNNEIVAISEDVEIKEFRQGLKVSVQLYREDFGGVYRQIWSELDV
jgi:DNA polymerase sigma